MVELIKDPQFQTCGLTFAQYNCERIRCSGIFVQKVIDGGAAFGKLFKGTIHLRRRQIFTNFRPLPPYRRQFLCTIRRQIWPIFDPSPPKACRRLKWMVPKETYYSTLTLLQTLPLLFLRKTKVFHE